MRRVHGRALVVGAALLLVILLGSTGWSHYSAGGSGTGTAATRASVQSLTLTSAVPTDHLYPGARSGVALTVSNPNPGPLRVGSLALDTGQGTSGFAVDGSHAACGVSSLSFTAQTNGGLGWTIPANGSLSLNLTNALGMSVDAANACQGATFTVYLKAGE